MSDDATRRAQQTFVGTFHRLLDAVWAGDEKMILQHADELRADRDQWISRQSGNSVDISPAQITFVGE